MPWGSFTIVLLKKKFISSLLGWLVGAWDNHSTDECSLIMFLALKKILVLILFLLFRKLSLEVLFLTTNLSADNVVEEASKKRGN